MMVPCAADPNRWSRNCVSDVAPGGAELPAMLPRNVLSAIGASEMLPLEVIGPPVSPVPVPTLVTVPAPVGLSHIGSAPGPCVLRYLPAAESGGSVVQIVPPRYATEPRTLPTTASMIAVSVFGDGAALAPLIFARTFPVEIVASEIVPVAVIGEPPVLMPAPAAMLVTPAEPAPHVGSAPAPAVCRNCPAVPGASATQAAPLR